MTPAEIGENTRATGSSESLALSGIREEPVDAVREVLDGGRSATSGPSVAAVSRRSNATTGLPTAMYSATLINVLLSLRAFRGSGDRQISQLAMHFTSRALSAMNPRNDTCSARPCRSTSARAAGTISPSPTKTMCQSERRRRSIASASIASSTPSWLPISPTYPSRKRALPRRSGSGSPGQKTSGSGPLRTTKTLCGSIRPRSMAIARNDSFGAITTSARRNPRRSTMPRARYSGHRSRTSPRTTPGTGRVGRKRARRLDGVGQALRGATCPADLPRGRY